MSEPNFDLAAAQRWFAVHCYNRAWDFINMKERSPEQNEEMIQLALASAYHWSQRPDSTMVNRSISLWQISRVYALAGQADNARRYAQMCLSASQGEEVPAFYLGYAYEALARAEAVAGNCAGADEFLAKARQIAAGLTDKEELDLLLPDLDSI